ncbi:MAG: adenylate/guanylate cyclase domain-containing protein, partial [Simkaniaceae bacterium]|nr:adenylate/guanylate cyclase domain-containing protein [Simkaniaceae bacterium]
PFIEPKSEKATRYYVLFKPESIMKFDTASFRFPLLMLSVNPLQPFLDWVPYRGEVRPMSPFAQSIEKAQAFLRAQPKMLKRHSVQAPMHGDHINNRTKEIIDLYEQVGMIWGLSTFALADESVAPVGMARQSEGMNLGLLGDEVFHKTPQIKMPKKDTGKFSIFPAEELKRVFFGRTVDEGKIAIGLDGGQILHNLSVATNEYVLFFADGDLIAATDKSGSRISSGPWNQVLLSEMIGNTSGFVGVDGKEYFYLHLKPVADLDFHFFLFQPKEEAFKLVYSLDKDTKTLLHILSVEMRIIAVVSLVVVLTLLHFVSRRITKPIAKLASATKQVAEGKYEDVDLPEALVTGRKDEVGQLYHSFRDMIDGMIEKERVRGVLNKVVSAEIAEEILKEDIHLGGEEREVTVLFGDIRQFTKLTEKMPPAETIQLLNECMTRIAKIIDAHGGVIDKFVGDEVMALFGAPIDKPASTLEAVKCGIEIIQDLRMWNDQRKSKGLMPIEMGVGI